MEDFLAAAEPEAAGVLRGVDFFAVILENEYVLSRERKDAVFILERSASAKSYNLFSSSKFPFRRH